MKMHISVGLLGLPSMLTAQTIAGEVLHSATRAPAARVVVIATDIATGHTSITRSGAAGTFYMSAKPGAYDLVFVTGISQPQSGGRVRVERDDFKAANYVVSLATDSVYLEHEVDQLVAPMPKNLPPRYPQALREAGTLGEVVAQFVVDSTGRAVPESFYALRATASGFIPAVEAAVQLFRFYPAQHKGRPVAQRVIMPFQFSITRGP